MQHKHLYKQYNNCTFVTNHYYNPQPAPSHEQHEEPVQTAPAEPTQAHSLNEILPIPSEGKYSQVRVYIKERAKFDKEFAVRVKNDSRVDLCKYLTNLFGWYVDANSLGKNMNRKT